VYSVFGLQNRLDEVNRALKGNEVELGNLTENINNVDYEIRSLQESAARLQKRISSITDSRVAFLRKIPQKFSAAAVASDWVRDNQRRFRSEVYGPVGMHIRVRTESIMHYICTIHYLSHFCVCPTAGG
jgi:chromosome segregation ATPase